jgi:hypothetical protein
MLRPCNSVLTTHYTFTLECIIILVCKYGFCETFPILVLCFNAEGQTLPCHATEFLNI